MAKAVEQENSKNLGKFHWRWPIGVLATGLGGIAVVALRGCWHTDMSWPVRAQGYSYQVCLGCGIKRLFDEKTFLAFGPYRYDLNQLISLQESKRSKSLPTANIQRPAS
jgi:hypothetical protein